MLKIFWPPFRLSLKALFWLSFSATPIGAIFVRCFAKL